MKFTRSFAALSAGIVAVSACAVSASAFDMGNADGSWNQVDDFITNESPELSGIDITKITKVVYKITVHNDGAGWYNGKVCANSKAKWQEKSFGFGIDYQGNPYGVTLTGPTTLSIELPLDGSDYWFKLSYGAAAVTGGFTIDSIEFYNGSEIMGTWKDGTYTAGGSVKPGDDDDTPDTPVIPDVPVKTSVKAELYSWTGLAAGLDLSGNDLFNAVANAVFVKSDVKDLKLGIDYTYDITVSGNTAVVKLVVLNDDLVLTDDSVTSTVLKLYSNKTADDVIDDVVEDDDIPDASPFMALPAAGFSAAAGSTDTADTDNNSSIDGTAGKNVDFENVAAGAGMTDEAASDNFDAVAVGAVVAAALAAAATVVAAKKQRN